MIAIQIFNIDMSFATLLFICCFKVTVSGELDHDVDVNVRIIDDSGDTGDIR